jgi:hypothetical protein
VRERNRGRGRKDRWMKEGNRRRKHIEKWNCGRRGYV